MSKIILGTPKFRDIERWEAICEDHKVQYILHVKESKAGFEEKWYRLTMYVVDDKVEDFMNDIREGWKPETHRRGKHARLY